MKFASQLAVLVLCMIQLSSASEEYQKNAEKLHNEYRTKHKVSALKLDDNLNKLAQKCADYYLNKKTIDHTCKDKGKAGENLAMASGSFTEMEYSKTATDMWYNEVSKYNYEKATFSGDTGHFTQLVWKDSQKLGFAIAKKGNDIVAVALYDPLGNMMGSFKDNVLKP